MSITSPEPSSPQTQQWDPQQGEMGTQHGLTQYQMQRQQVTPQQLHAAGWMDCPRCHKFWMDPQTKAQVEAQGGYFTCPKCRLTTDLMHNLPWHGVEEEDYYPRGNTGGGTAIGLPMEDVGQIGENIVLGMGGIPGYGQITWWHPGGAGTSSPLDGAVGDWGVEVKTAAYDSASHFWHPGSGKEVQEKSEQARQMGFKGILGVFVLLNFRNDTADVYVKEMPLDPWVNAQGRMQPGGAAKWHKRTGIKVAQGIPFESPYKDPHNPAPGPYRMADYYKKPQFPGWEPPSESMPF